MSTFLLAFLIGVVAGLRSMTSPAAVSWAARLGRLELGNTFLAFMGYAATPYILTAAAIGELINDKLPWTPSRRIPPSFAFRVVSGGFCGAALGVARGSLWAGMVAGMLGAAAGTLGGAEFRSRLAKAIGKDLPAALLEDAIAVFAAVAIVRPW